MMMLILMNRNRAPRGKGQLHVDSIATPQQSMPLLPVVPSAPHLAMVYLLQEAAHHHTQQCLQGSRLQACTVDCSCPKLHTCQLHRCGKAHAAHCKLQQQMSCWTTSGLSNQMPMHYAQVRLLQCTFTATRSLNDLGIFMSHQLLCSAQSLTS